MTSGATPLIIASYLGLASCVSLLLTDLAINLELLFQDSSTLQLTEQINVEGRAEVVQLLVDAGAQPSTNV